MKHFFLIFAAGALVLLLASSCSTPALTDPQRELLAASRSPRSAAQVKYSTLLARVENKNFHDPETGYSPLGYAVHLQDREKVLLLLKNGADICYSDHAGRTVLHYAASLFDTEMLKLLLEHSATPDPRDKTGKTPLMEAARLGNLEAVKVLIGAGASVKIKDNEERGVLSFAALSKSYSLELVKYLLSQGAERAVLDKNNKSPLCYAIQSGNTPAAIYLLFLLPDFNLNKPTDIIGYVAMKEAIAAGNITVVRRVIQKKMPMNPDMSYVLTGMELANIEGLHEFMARENIVSDGKTPIFWAAEAENTEIIQILFDAGADPRMKDFTGNRPEDFARQRNTIQLLRHLCQKKDEEEKAKNEE